jgi:hypothetical protein
LQCSGEVDEKSRSAIGGVLSLLWYPAALAWVIWYLVGCVSTGTLLTTQTSFETFSEDPAATELLPPMRCISPGGCWVHPMNASDRSSSGAVEGVECYYLKQNQDFPPFMRRLFLTPDPVQGLSVVFDATPSFFSVSYDQDRIEDLRTGAVKKKERGGLEKTTSPRIYQGSALMQLTRTSMGGAIPWSVDSWSSVTTSTFGGVTKPWNKCCKAETVGMIDHNGGDTVLTTDPAFTMANRRCDVAGISQTTIAPFPTINNVQVQDWVMQGFESFGGISGTISLFSIVIIWLIRTLWKEQETNKVDTKGGSGPFALSSPIVGMGPQQILVDQNESSSSNFGHVQTVRTQDGVWVRG